MRSVDLDLSDVLVRLLAAAAAGGLVGLNRDLADKPIGVRTLGLVSLGAATVAVAGIQVQGIAENPDALSRVVQGVIQGVMAGISFIGAGVILRNVETRNVEGIGQAGHQLALPQRVRLGVLPVDALLFQAEGDAQLPLREGPPLAPLPWRACAAPLSQR
jgi:hypothetical protein